MTEEAAQRRYHHGDLRSALVDAALERTRSVGPRELSLREVTRDVGVSPAAAYRHFADRSQLLGATAFRIQEKMGETMRRRMRAPRDATPLHRALARVRGVGLGYIAFAVAEPGWFETAFFGDRDSGLAALTAQGVPPPFALLTDALDDLVAAGGLSAGRRTDAEFVCWSAVHGCAELLIHGPLRDADAATARRISERVVDDIITGVTADPAT